MPGFREAREALLMAHFGNAIDDTEFILLYDVNKSKNPNFLYWYYDKFDLDNLNEDECIANFRFKKNDIHDMKTPLQIPDNYIAIMELKSMVSRHYACL